MNITESVIIAMVVAIFGETLVCLLLTSVVGSISMTGE